MRKSKNEITLQTSLFEIEEDLPLAEDPTLQLKVGCWYVTEEEELVRLVAKDKPNPQKVTRYAGVVLNQPLGVAILELYDSSGISTMGRGGKNLLCKCPDLLSLKPLKVLFRKSKTFRILLKRIFTASHPVAFWSWGLELWTGEKFLKPTVENFKRTDPDDR